MYTVTTSSPSTVPGPNQIALRVLTRNLFWGEKLRGGGEGSAPGSEVVTTRRAECHLGASGGMHPHEIFF